MCIRDRANALFAKGYNIYSLFLMVATAGIPSAISKMVAHYNGINQYGVSRRLYRSGMYVSVAVSYTHLPTIGAPNQHALLPDLTVPGDLVLDRR